MKEKIGGNIFAGAIQSTRVRTPFGGSEAFFRIVEAPTGATFTHRFHDELNCYIIRCELCKKEMRIHMTEVLEMKGEAFKIRHIKCKGALVGNP